jgi:threonine/homoserine/homoserine lactone efflux protein
MQAAKGLSMEKWLCWGSIGIGALLFVLFTFNLILHVPFGEAINPAVEIVNIIAGGLLVYLGWNALRDLR